MGSSINGHAANIIEQITYSCDARDTTDLEAATKAVSAVAEPAADDYTSAALTLPAPTDTRLTVQRLCARIQVTIDSLNAGAAHLYVRCYVDTVDANHRLFDLDLQTPAAQKLSAVDLTSSSLATIYNALRDGGAHTLKFRLWVDAGDIVVSEIRVYYGIGSSGTAQVECLRISTPGEVSVSMGYTRIGTGTMADRLGNEGTLYRGAIGSNSIVALRLCQQYLSLMIYGTVTTDINYLQTLQVIVKGLGV